MIGLADYLSYTGGSLQEMIDRYSRELMEFRQKTEAMENDNTVPTFPEPNSDQLFSQLKDELSQLVDKFEKLKRDIAESGVRAANASPQPDSMQEILPPTPNMTQPRTDAGNIQPGAMPQQPDMVQPRTPMPTQDMTNRPPNTIEKGTAQLKIYVFTADEALPIEGATIFITSSETGEEVLSAVTKTGRDGQTESLALPASVAIGTDQTLDPASYTNYRVYINADGYAPQNRNVQLVATIAATLPVAMTPRSSTI